MKKILIVCSGLDKIRRGYETHARTLFPSLQQENNLDVFLMKRTGEKATNEIITHMPSRRSWACQVLSRWRGEPLYWEGFFSSLFLLYYSIILRNHFDFIYTQELMVSKIIHKLSDYIPGKPKVIFAHGVSIEPKDYLGCADIFQEVNVENYNKATKLSNKEIFHIPHHLLVKSNPATSTEKEIIKKKYGIKAQLNIISIGVVDRTQKRMDYLIDEVIALRNPNIGLIICGKGDGDIINYAQEQLGDRFKNLFLPNNEVLEVCRGADVFVSCSLQEGFGIVFLEAMHAGLPIIAHDRELFRWIINTPENLVNMTKKGELSKLLNNELSESWLEKKTKLTLNNYDTRFTWKAVRGRYLEMFN